MNSLAEHYKSQSEGLYWRFKAVQQFYYDLGFKGMADNNPGAERSMEDPQSWDAVDCAITKKPYVYQEQHEGQFVLNPE
jgi:hypothetical protein